jgi:hypothetical protein
MAINKKNCSHHDIAEILLKLELNTKSINKSMMKKIEK